jgi:hypothetical protein
MATHFEVFDKLRDLGKSLDKISHTLPADGNTEETNKARASLHLRALLTEAKNFKVLFSFLSESHVQVYNASDHLTSVIFIYFFCIYSINIHINS